MNNFISVIIPVYNRAKLLHNALESLSQQIYPKELYEIIVVDNNSTDEINIVIDEFLKKNNSRLNFKFVKEVRQGLVYSRHTGAINSVGEILVFGDDDGVYENNWLSAINEVYSDFPNVGAVGTKIQIKWDSKAPNWISKYQWVLGELTYGNGITIKETGMYINGGSFSIKKNILFEVEGFNIGQVGKYLLGDCETGLCRKLHDNKIPIGFTDKTTMWHIQFVNLQGTLKDIKRRFYNNGIADAFHDIIISKTMRMYKKQRRVFRFYIKIFYYTLFFWKKEKLIDTILNLTKYKAYFEYCEKYKSDKEIINLLNNKDWILNSNYQKNGPVLKSTYGEL